MIRLSLMKLALLIGTVFSVCWSDFAYADASNGNTGSSQPEDLVIPAPRSAVDLSHHYHSKLLSLALKAGATADSPAYIVKSDMKMVEGRATLELIKGQLLDVFWMGTDTWKEQHLRAIPVPTTRGLIGFRKLIIRQADRHKFDSVSELEDLSSLVACQGTDWPDTLILRGAGLSVSTTVDLESLYGMLNAGRCDYFPRALHDHQSELDLRKSTYPDLIRYDNIMLHYPFAVYFFVSKEREALAQQIERGLNELINSGQFVALMQSHPLTARVMPLATQKDVKWFTIANLYLPATTRYCDNKYWFTKRDFGLDETCTPEPYLGRLSDLN